MQSRCLQQSYPSFSPQASATVCLLRKVLYSKAERGINASMVDAVLRSWSPYRLVSVFSCPERSSYLLVADHLLPWALDPGAGVMCWKLKQEPP